MSPSGLKTPFLHSKLVSRQAVLVGKAGLRCCIPSTLSDLYDRFCNVYAAEASRCCMVRGNEMQGWECLAVPFAMSSQTGVI